MVNKKIFEPAQPQPDELLLTSAERLIYWLEYPNSDANHWDIEGLLKAQLAKATPSLLAEGARKAYKAVGEWFENNWHPYWTYTRAEDIIVALKSGKLPE